MNDEVSKVQNTILSEDIIAKNGKFVLVQMIRSESETSMEQLDQAEAQLHANIANCERDITRIAQLRKQMENAKKGKPQE